MTGLALPIINNIANDTKTLPHPHHTCHDSWQDPKSHSKLQQYVRESQTSMTFFSFCQSNHKAEASCLSLFFMFGEKKFLKEASATQIIVLFFSRQPFIPELGLLFQANCPEFMGFG